VDEFIQTRTVGTSIGNTLLRRYLQNTKWIKNSLSQENEQTFINYLRFFKQYAAEYNFDYLMIAAQGYQESLLDPKRKEPGRRSRRVAGNTKARSRQSDQYP
jgi:membrane-bound lytic murein transglycosylase MltF